MKKSCAVALSFAALAVQSGCEWLRGPQAPGTPVQTIHPKRGEIVRRITLPGNVMAYQEATLYAKVTGYLKTISVDKGDTVKQGDLLAEIEAPEMLADLVKAKAEADAAQLDYKRVADAQKKASDLVMPQTVDAARAKSGVAVAGLLCENHRSVFWCNHETLGRPGRAYSRSDIEQRSKECSGCHSHGLQHCAHRRSDPRYRGAVREKRFAGQSDRGRVARPRV